MIIRQKNKRTEEQKNKRPFSRKLMNFCSCVIKNRDIKTKEQIKQDRRTEEQKAFQPQTYELMFLCQRKNL